MMNNTWVYHIERMCVSMMIHHVALLASERERTLEFYRTLGFEVKSSHVRPERGDEIVFMKLDCIVLELFISNGNPPRLSNPEASGPGALAVLEGLPTVESILPRP